MYFSPVFGSFSGINSAKCFGSGGVTCLRLVMRVYCSKEIALKKGRGYLEEENDSSLALLILLKCNVVSSYFPKMTDSVHDDLVMMS